MIESLTRARLATVLGAGACLLAGCSHGGATTAQDRTGAAGPASSVAAAAPPQAANPAPATTTGSPAAAASGSPGAAPKPRPSASSEDSQKVHAEIDAARAKAAKEGHPLMRALGEQGKTPYQEHTETTSEGMVRVQTAKGDLTGQQMMVMVADPGTPVGDARCTQRLRFANAAAVRQMPTVLLCWRVSASRSVVTFAVAKSGKPSPELSESIIDRAWAKL